MLRERVYFLDEMQKIQHIYALFYVCLRVTFDAMCHFMAILNRQNMNLSTFVLIFVIFCKRWGAVLANFVRERASFS